MECGAIIATKVVPATVSPPHVTREAVIAGHASQVLAEINVPPRAKMNIALSAPMTSLHAVNVMMVGMVLTVKKVALYHTVVFLLVTR